MELSKALNKRFIICIVEWDNTKIHSLHELKKKAGSINLKDRLIIKAKHKQRDSLLYTIIQSRAPLKENIRDAMRYGMMSQMPTNPDIKEIYSFDEWVEKYPFKTDK